MDAAAGTGAEYVFINTLLLLLKAFSLAIDTVFRMGSVTPRTSPAAGLAGCRAKGAVAEEARENALSLSQLALFGRMGCRGEAGFDLFLS